MPVKIVLLWDSFTQLVHLYSIFLYEKKNTYKKNSVFKTMSKTIISLILSFWSWSLPFFAENYENKADEQIIYILYGKVLKI